MKDAAAGPSKLVKALCNGACYDHDTDEIALRETHISYVFLTGPFAYKIKKPVTLPFLDFGTLEDRKNYCDEELRINRRLAPRLYLDVVPITGSEAQPRVNGTGTPIEYAVKMVQFPDADRLDRVAAEGRFRRTHIRALAEDIAEFHGSVAVAEPSSPFADSERLRRQSMDNFENLGSPQVSDDVVAMIETVRRWSARSLVELGGRFRARKRGSFIRECHGDMHLANMALLDGEIVIFDAIEFNESFRWIDVLSELAFVLMDLDYRAHPELGRILLSRYLEETGDYAGLTVLPHYLVYRAMVRAKVAGIRASQCQPGTREHRGATTELESHVELAHAYLEAPTHTPLIITHGLSGSGKSRLGERLVQRTGAIRIRSDVERKRLANQRRGRSTDPRDLYSIESTRRTYDTLARHARTVIESGHPVIIDATFLKRTHRDQFRQVATEQEVPFVILELDAPMSVLEQRVTRRAREADNVSDATLEVLHNQFRDLEALDAGEREGCISVDASAEFDVDELARRIFRTCRLPLEHRLNLPSARHPVDL